MYEGDQHISLVRQAEIAQCIAGLHAANWKNAFRDIFSDTYLDNEVEAERLRHWHRKVPTLASGVGEIFLASVSDKPAGFLCIEVGPEREWGVVVDSLHVLQHFRGAQIGSRLLVTAEHWARRRGENQLYLWVFEENHAARRFYQREGWREVERRSEEIEGGGERVVWRLIKRLR